MIDNFDTLNFNNPNINSSNFDNSNIDNSNFNNIDNFNKIDNFNNIDNSNKISIKKKYIENIDDNIADFIIPLIVVVLLVVFIIFIFSLLVSSNFQSTTPETPVITDNRGVLTKECNLGECATNIFNGYKVCSDDDSIKVKYNPAYETCNIKNGCSSPLTPYAVRADGSTNITGLCEDNVACSCVKSPQCPSYILSAFTTINGSLLYSSLNQRLIFPQLNNNTNNGIITSDNPIKLQNPVLQFCSAPLTLLQYASPGCISSSSTSPTGTDLINCMGMEKNCPGTIFAGTQYKSNPCLQGTLAVITNNPDTLRLSNVNTFLLGCVPGETCDCGKIAVYDTNFGAIQCMTIPP